MVLADLSCKSLIIEVECMGIMIPDGLENSRWLITCTANKQGWDDGVSATIDFGIIIGNIKEIADQFPYTGEV